MHAVEAVAESIVDLMKRPATFLQTAKPQDKKKQIRLCKRSEFTDTVIGDYLNNLPSNEEIKAKIQQRDISS